MQRRSYAFINGNSAISQSVYDRDQAKDSAEIEELKRKLPKNSPELNSQVTLTNSLLDLFDRATAAERHEIVHYLFKNIYFDFTTNKLTGFEPNPDYEILFSSLAEEKGWTRDESIYTFPVAA